MNKSVMLISFWIICTVLSFLVQDNALFWMQTVQSTTYTFDTLWLVAILTFHFITFAFFYVHTVDAIGTGRVKNTLGQGILIVISIVCSIYNLRILYYFVKIAFKGLFGFTQEQWDVDMVNWAASASIFLVFAQMFTHYAFEKCFVDLFGLRRNEKVQFKDSVLRLNK